MLRWSGLATCFGLDLRPFVEEQLIKITYEMLACYGIPYSFTELLQIHRSTKSVYGKACRIQVLLLRDVVSLAVLTVCCRAPYGYTDPSCWTSAGEGFVPGLE
jgi:hypothetical protein